MRSARSVSLMIPRIGRLRPSGLDAPSPKIDLDAKLLLESHDQLDHIERVHAKIRKRDTGRQETCIPPQLRRDRLANLVLGRRQKQSVLPQTLQDGPSQDVRADADRHHTVGRAAKQRATLRTHSDPRGCAELRQDAIATRWAPWLHFIAPGPGEAQRMPYHAS